MFVPSAHSYGADEASTPNALDKLTGLLRDAAPALSIAQELVGKSDREQAAILTAKIANYKRMMNVAPYNIVPGTLWYKNQIATMKARIKALNVDIATDDSVTRDYGVWRNLTSAAGVAGIGVVGMAAYFLYKRAQK